MTTPPSEEFMYPKEAPKFTDHFQMSFRPDAGVFLDFRSLTPVFFPPYASPPEGQQIAIDALKFQPHTRLVMPAQTALNLAQFILESFQAFEATQPVTPEGSPDAAK
jgi:hypothetical protein